MDYRVLVIPVLLAANALFLYWFLGGNPEYDALAEHKKHEFLARINGLLFIVYIVTMRVFTTTHAGAMEQISQIVAYLIYDCAHAPFYARGYDYYIHHAVYFLIYISQFTTTPDIRVSQFYDAACILESSAPVLSIGWFMDALGYPMDTFHQVTRVALFLIWTFIRMMCFPYWIGTAIDTKDIVYTLPFVALNCYWFWLLIKKATKSTTSSSPSPAAESPDPQPTEDSGSARSSPREPRT
jgi:hypothetical protein